MKCVTLLSIFFLLIGESFSQSIAAAPQSAKATGVEMNSHLLKQYSSAARLLDAALNSLNALNALIRKESYRNKISSFNNPTASGLGFSLDAEIQHAIRPLLNKTRNTNRDKFAQVVSSVVSSPARAGGFQPGMTSSAVFNTLVGLLRNLAVQEKKVTKEDLDSFVTLTGKYFRQYEKLNGANQKFDEYIKSLAGKAEDLQFDIRAYMTDLITVVHPGLPRATLKEKTLEELLLTYLDPVVIESVLSKDAHEAKVAKRYFPADALKGAKEFSYDLQKLFNDYLKAYSENYEEITNILNSTKALGKSVNGKQVDQSLSELEQLYKESRQADILNLRLTTLFERLHLLVQTELLPM